MKLLPRTLSLITALVVISGAHARTLTAEILHPDATVDRIAVITLPEDQASATVRSGTTRRYFAAKDTVTKGDRTDSTFERASYFIGVILTVEVAGSYVTVNFERSTFVNDVTSADGQSVAPNIQTEKTASTVSLASLNDPKGAVLGGLSTDQLRLLLSK